MPFLSVKEVIALTGKKYKKSQVIELRFMGIEQRIRRDGTVLVSRNHVEKLLDGESRTPRIERRMEPNWSAMDAKKP